MLSHLAFLLPFVLPALAAELHAARTWDELFGNCTSVSASEFESIAAKTQTAHIGPGGVYTISDHGSCAYLDASPSGSLAVERPEVYGDFAHWLSNTGLHVPFLGGQDRKVKRDAYCGDICDGSGRSRVPCVSGGCTNCKIYSQYYQGTYYSYISTCQG
ncbi:hypothetical protein F5Y17DRAFT_197553 [Xylariaceae sp. FL0594]|nr:hypothetical protein F5Y17DRAFT_197553 [Xylariaceae sp. FL0594]